MMKKIMKFLINLILSCLSMSPVISITMDQNFHGIPFNNNKPYNNFRYSLISFGYGAIKIYIITYKKDNGFAFLKILKLSEIVKLPSEEEILQKIVAYRNHIADKEPNVIDIEIDFLKYKIDDEEKVKDLSNSKINNYSAIVMVLIPLMLSSGLKFVLDLNNKLLIIIGFAMLYNLINVIAYIFDFYKVKSFSRSTFKDLKESQDHNKKLAESYYEDWYSIRAEAPFFVSYVKNVEKYIKISMIFMIFFIIFSNFHFTKPLYKAPLNKNVQTYNSSAEITFSNSGEIRMTDLIKLKNIQEQILENKVRKIILLTNIAANKLINEKCHLLIESIKMYNVNKIEINEISNKSGLRNLQTQPNLITILMIGVKK